MNSAAAQIRALVGLRWRMVRSRRSRLGLALLGVLLFLFVVAAVAGGRLASSEEAFNAALVMPTGFLVYALLSIVGPAAAGGGNELFPAEDVVPHPIRPTTRFVTSVLLSPLNIAWVTQSTALLALTSFVATSWSGLPAALTAALLYILAVTVCGQAGAWWLVGIRQTPRGRTAAWVGLALLVGLAAVALQFWALTDFLDHSPTRPVVIGILEGALGDYHTWTWVVVSLVALAALGLLLGVLAARFSARRPLGAAVERQARRLPRRAPAASLRHELRRIDRASVWRAGSLRRGVLVMGLLPGAAAAAVRVDWSSLALTGGLVAAGAGLLFGINAFCLDGPGGLWLASSPLPPETHLLSKARVIAEMCLICCLLTVAAGASRVRGDLSATDVATVLCAVAVCTGAVVASCLRSSVETPHRAELRGGRDTPAPPGAMAVHSAKLAVRTTLLAMFVVGMGATGMVWAPVALAAALLTLSWLSVRRSLDYFAQPQNRANVLITVATG
jgi:hypothetical protein